MSANLYFNPHVNLIRVPQDAELAELRLKREIESGQGYSLLLLRRVLIFTVRSQEDAHKGPV